MDADRQAALFHELIAGLSHHAPGSDASTRRALGLVPGLPAAPVVADMGCGPGAASLVLAEALPEARIVALDLLMGSLARLRARAPAGMLPVLGDMLRPPLAPGSVDLIWAEGSAYVLGLAKALRAWQPLLRPSGCLAVSDAVWLTGEPPPEARAFWGEDYPQMTDRDGALAALRAAGMEPVVDFVLPADDWDAYYVPLEARLRQLRANHPGDADAEAVAEAVGAEIDLFRRHGASYGYLFMVAMRPT